MALIAREAALCLATLSFSPRVDHTPGIAHILADALSRVTQKDDDIFKTHPALKNAVKHDPPVRNKQWYRTLLSFK